MATKKSAADTGGEDVTAAGTGAREKQLEDRRKRREEATTVDGSETPSSANAGGASPEAAPEAV